MNKIEWKDESGYSRGERGNVPPTVLATKIMDTRISIHRHIWYPKTWLLSSGDLNIENKDLKTDNFEEAKSIAINYLITYLEKYLKLRSELQKFKEVK